jgi:hypothetical protein
MFTPLQRQKMIDAVLEYLRCGGGAESLSFVHRSLAQDGWKRLGHIDAFRAELQSMGFVVRKGVNERGQERTEVTL